MKKVAILQSNYIPWKGYFDIIGLVDEFIVLDSVQYTRRDWRNRNLIKTRDGLKWLTIPVNVKGKFLQRIDETTVQDGEWAELHWKSLCHQYGHAPYFSLYRERLAGLYQRAATQKLLSEINLMFIEEICSLVGISTRLSSDADYELVEGKNERLLHLCRQAGGEIYLSGPAARGYIDEAFFAAGGVRVEWMDYCGYPDYPQLYLPFEHGVTMLDLLFNVGPAAGQYMKWPINKKSGRFGNELFRH